MVHFNDILGVTASILIKSSGGNLSDYLAGKVFLNRGVFLLTVLAQSMRAYHIDITRLVIHVF